MVKVLGIVILNYNTWSEVKQCVESIVKFPPSDKYHIYVIDNNSSETIQDDVKDYLMEESVEIVWNKENKGYAAGNNIGLKRAIDDNCDACLICNSDICFVDNSIDVLHQFVVKEERIGLVGPQIYNTKGEFQPFYMMIKLTATGKLKNMALHTPVKFLFRKFEKEFICKNEIKKPHKVFGVSGCCFMLSGDCLRYVYPLDESTFLYEEEYILGSILEHSQFSIYIVPDTHVIHAHGASTGGMTEFSYNCLIKSEQYYLKKYLKTNVILRKVIYLLRVYLKKHHVKKDYKK